jgi:hypothetical protein
MISYENEVPGDLSLYAPAENIIYLMPTRMLFLHLISRAVRLEFFRETFTHIIVYKFSNHSSR